MTKRKGRTGERLDVIGRLHVARLLERDDITELEIVFELYCGLWDLVGDLPRRAAVLFVLEELAYSEVSEALAKVLGELRALPFVESAGGAAGDRDNTWFGLQIMINELLARGESLMSPEWRARVDALGSSASPASATCG